MQKSPTECRTVERTGRECVECWVTKMNVKIPGEAVGLHDTGKTSMHWMNEAEPLKKAQEKKLAFE